MLFPHEIHACCRRLLLQNMEMFRPWIKNLGNSDPIYSCLVKLNGLLFYSRFTFCYVGTVGRHSKD